MTTPQGPLLIVATLRYYAKWIPSGDRRYVDVLDRELEKLASEKTWHQNLAPTPTNAADDSEVIEWWAVQGSNLRPAD